MTSERLSDRLRCVLVRTSLAGNIGSSARALRTMGLRRLSLVAPYNYPHPDATAFAAGGADLLDDAAVLPDLAAAIADSHLVIGASARRRGVALPEWSPRTAAANALAAIQEGREVAFVFGNERTGLENEELKLCHAAVLIPSDPDYSSLNLAQAVQVIAYELRLALLDATQQPAEPLKQQPLPTHAEIESFFDHLARTLDDIDFHKGRSPRTILRRMRRFFLRAAPDQRELQMLRGVLSDAQRMARLAGRGDASDG